MEANQVNIQKMKLDSQLITDVCEGQMTSLGEFRGTVTDTKEI